MISEESVTKYKPIQAVIVYKKENRDYYLETHPIMEQGDKYSWGEGRPFLKEQLKELAISLGNKSFEPISINGLMPEKILYIKQSFFTLNLLWYLAPSEQELHFVDKLNLPTGKVKLPGLIFKVVDKELSVFAFKGSDKPTLKTELFKAPFHNIYDDGRVCMGNVKDNKTKSELNEEMLRWERRFFNSNFSHFLDGQVIKQGVNLSVVFKDLMKYKKQFPEEYLLPSELKIVENLLKDLKK